MAVTAGGGASHRVFVRFGDDVAGLVLRAADARIHVSALAAHFNLDPASIRLDGMILEADKDGYRHALQWAGLTVALLLTLKRSSKRLFCSH